MLEAAISYLRELNFVSMCLRLLLAMFGGALIGATRGKRQHAAGMRTHILVCIGAACAVMVGQFSANVLKLEGDPMRIAAQVVSGIGFLGAGSIIVSHHKQVTGLTTAAGLWASACMGLAAGVGFYECAIAMCVLIFVSLVVLNRIDKVFIKSTTIMSVYVEFDSHLRMSRLLSGLGKLGMEVVSIERMGSDTEDTCGYRVELELVKPKLTSSAALGLINTIEGVMYVEELRY
ncbi:MAG: MgtC/SapB family protein [Oscillospiraceae bacterium]|nr:MgtC/SapB family protein [Oscillospiraceae bacterium]